MLVQLAVAMNHRTLKNNKNNKQLPSSARIVMSVSGVKTADPRLR